MLFRSAGDTEKKAEGNDAKPKDADKGDEGEKDSAPAEYDDFTMPEGIEVDEKALSAFKPIAKDMNLSQEKAQKFVDIYTQGVKESTEASTKAWADLQEAWVGETKADKEVGGDKSDEADKLVAVAMKKLGTDKLKDVLELTGVGNNVEMKRLLARVGKVLSDDTIDLGRMLGEGPKSRAEILYPNQGKT